MGDLKKSGWSEVEKLLAKRKHTVFAGHVHCYQKSVRNGANYYMNLSKNYAVILGWGRMV